MPETSPAYLWYPKDVLSSGKVSELSGLEECWYRRALDHAWLDEGLPSDPAKCARRIGKNCTSKAAAMILNLFFEASKKNPLRMVNKKQEILRKELRQKARQRSEAGRLSGVSRRQKRDLTAEQTFNERSNKTRTKTNIAIASSIPIADKKTSSNEEVLNSTEQREKLEPKILLPADYRPPYEQWQWGHENCKSLDLAEELEEFITYWREIATKNNKRTLRGWNATWKTRMKERQERTGIIQKNGTGNGQNRTSEREKSASRGANVELVADEMERQARSELEALSRDDAASGQEIDQLSERSVVNRG